jgi:5-formyltetrahydrofolate cyclo-ligase
LSPLRKTDLRRRAKSTLAAVGDRDSRAIVEPLLSVAGRGPIALFASMGDEIDTAPLDDAARARGLVRLYPQVRGDELVFRALPTSVSAHELPRAKFGAPEPTVDFSAVPLSSCSLVVVPGLAFDARGGRLGYGRGYYDRALAGIDIERAVGLCFDEQIVDEVPMAEHDVRLPRLCTPSRGVFRVI